jgi:hypothetical protein
MIMAANNRRDHKALAATTNMYPKVEFIIVEPRTAPPKLDTKN